VKCIIRIFVLAIFKTVTIQSGIEEMLEVADYIVLPKKGCLSCRMPGMARLLWAATLSWVLRVRGMRTESYGL